MKFHDFAQAVAARLPSFPPLHEMLDAWPAHVDKWPSSAAKFLIEGYRTARTLGKTHENAALEMHQRPEFDLVAGRDFGLPFDEDSIRQLFVRAFRRERAERLGHAITADPENAEKHIRDYELVLETGDEVVDIAQALPALHKAYESKVFEGQAVTTIPGFERLAGVIGGFNPARLAICKAITGFGKTNLALNLALAARTRMNVLYVNMEMNMADLAERVYAIETGKSFAQMRRDGVGDITRLMQKLTMGSRLRITSGRDKSVTEIRALTRREASRDPLGLLIVDYDQKLQLDLAKGTPEWLALQKAMIALEAIAKELSCFVLVLAQTNADGDISGSFRSQFPAASVWSFKNDDDLGAVISFDKNRFGERTHIVGLTYDTHCARISERELIRVVPQRPRGADL